MSTLCVQNHLTVYYSVNPETEEVQYVFIMYIRLNLIINLSYFLDCIRLGNCKEMAY